MITCAAPASLLTRTSFSCESGTSPTGDGQVAHATQSPKGRRREGFQHGAERLEAGCRHTATPSLPERFEEEAFQFERLAALEVDQGRSFVGAHRACALDVFLHDGLVELEAERLGGMDDFEHQFADDFAPGRIGQKLVGGETRAARSDGTAARESFEAGAAGDAEAIEWNIPDELLPMGAGEVVGDVAGDAGALKHRAKVVRARLGPAPELAEHDAPVVDVLHDSRSDAIEADETKPAQDLFRLEKGGELFLVAQAVLECQQRGARTNQRREKLRKLLIGSGLQRDDDEVGDANPGRFPSALRTRVEVALGAANGDAVSAHNLVIGTEQEMHVAPVATEFAAVEAAYGATADKGDFHGVGEDWS